jgi:hypothetical protein
MPTNDVETNARKAAQRRRAAQRANVTPAAMKLEEARHYIGGLSVPMMFRLINQGVLHPNRHLRHLLFSREQLDKFLRDVRPQRSQLRTRNGANKRRAAA